MTVIAMTREMGSLGKDVAAGVAENLGISVVHHELIERQLADRLQTSESAVHRFLEGEASMWERWQIDSKRLSRFTSEEILDLAAGGDVLIRGWGAAQLLRDVPHVICVRVCAPISNRIAEMKKRLGVDNADAARKEIERNDEAHARTVQRQFHADWTDASDYDVVLNTGFIPIEDCVALLGQLAKGKAYDVTEESRSRLTDKLLESRIQSLLDERISDSPIGSGLGVVVNRGHVTIDGVVGPGKSAHAIVDEIRSVEGVKSLTDDTVTIATTFGP